MTVTPPVDRTVLFVVKAPYVVTVSEIIKIISMITPTILRLIFLMLICFELIFVSLTLIELIFLRMLEVVVFFADACEAFCKVLKSISFSTS